VFLEGVGDVFEEDKAEDDVLVFRRVHVVAQLVGGEPELGLEAQAGGGITSRLYGLGHLDFSGNDVGHAPDWIGIQHPLWTAVALESNQLGTEQVAERVGRRQPRSALRGDTATLRTWNLVKDQTPKCRWANSWPEPLFRYFSNDRASSMVSNAA